jgi:hypothetical protein
MVSGISAAGGYVKLAASLTDPGFITMCVGPIFTAVLYDKLEPKWFAYAWMIVWISGYFTVAFCVPAVALFFWNIQWCCSRRNKNFPGQVQWNDACALENGRLRRLESHQSNVDGKRFNEEYDLTGSRATSTTKVADDGRSFILESGVPGPPSRWPIDPCTVRGRAF